MCVCVCAFSLGYDVLMPGPVDGGLAQTVERLLCMREVPGSIPGSSSLLFSFYSPFFLVQKLYKLCYATCTWIQAGCSMLIGIGHLHLLRLCNED